LRRARWKAQQSPRWDARVGRHLTHWGRVTQICVYTHINNLNTRSPMC
jgi:hypothetical protein